MTPRQWQNTVIGVLVVVAVLVQTVVIARLPLPGPPMGLVVAVVVGAGMARGSGAGAAAGFAGGLLLDILPPATGTIAVAALALLVVGALAGRIPDPRGLAPVQLAGVAGALAAVAWGLEQGLRWLLGDATVPVVWGVWFAAGTALVSLAVVPAVGWAIRRVTGSGRRRPRPRAPAGAGRP
jgi:rod shape-determining protein MreD